LGSCEVPSAPSEAAVLPSRPAGFHRPAVARGWPALLELRSASESCRSSSQRAHRFTRRPLRPSPCGRTLRFSSRRPRCPVSPEQPSSRAVPLSFRASSRRSCRSPCGSRPASPGVFRPSAPSARGVHVRRRSHPSASFRLQGSSPSCRFPPPRASRACFIPEALVGFALQGFPLPRSRAVSSTAVALLAFTRRWPPAVLGTSGSPAPGHRLAAIPKNRRSPATRRSRLRVPARSEEPRCP
jgi:hypothetical protein